MGMLSQLARAALLGSLLVLALAFAAACAGALPAAGGADAEHILWNAGCWLFGLGLVVTLGRPRELARASLRCPVSPARSGLAQPQNVARGAPARAA